MTEDNGTGLDSGTEQWLSLQWRSGDSGDWVSSVSRWNWNCIFTISAESSTKKWIDTQNKLAVSTHWFV
jgi:hypothetical protein